MILMKNICIELSYLAVLTLLLILATGCPKSIVIPDSKYNAPAFSMFGEIPQRNFFIQKVLSDSIRLKWSADINGGINTAALALHGETIFCSDLSGRIYAFKISDGKVQGYLSYKNLIIAAPIVNQLKIIFATVDSKENKSTIYQYDFKLGKVIYEIEIPGKVIKEIIRLEDSFIVLTEQGNVLRYHYNSNKLWEFTNSNFIHSTAAANEDKLIFGDDKGNVIILNIKTGEKIVQLNIRTGIESGFAIYNNNAYFGDNNGNIHSLDLNTYKFNWSASIGFKTVTFPMIDGNNLFIGNVKGELFKVDLKDGSINWKTETKGNINTTGLIFENIIVQPDYNKRILFIDKKDGTILKSVSFEDKLKLSPLFYNDLIFVGTETGQLFAYEVINY